MPPTFRLANVTTPCYAGPTNEREAPSMTIKIHTRLTRKYLSAPEVMTDPYTEERSHNGFPPALYLVNGDGNLAILCDAIVDIEEG